jgi:CheY-like chemotaxis protein
MLRILLVDPDPSVSGVLSDALTQEFAADVTCAASGALASLALHGKPWDLAVMEATLPDMTGYELAELAATNNVPGLLIAGHPQAQEKCRVLGYPHLDKPFALAALQAAATTVLRDTRRNVQRLHEAYERLAECSLRARRKMDGIGRSGRQSSQISPDGWEVPYAVGSAREGVPGGVRHGRADLPIEVRVALTGVFHDESLLQPEKTDEKGSERYDIVPGKGCKIVFRAESTR